MSFFAPTVTV